MSFTENITALATGFSESFENGSLLKLTLSNKRIKNVALLMRKQSERKAQGLMVGRRKRDPPGADGRY